MTALGQGFPSQGRRGICLGERERGAIGVSWLPDLGQRRCTAVTHQYVVGNAKAGEAVREKGLTGGSHVVLSTFVGFPVLVKLK